MPRAGATPAVDSMTVQIQANERFRVPRVDATAGQRERGATGRLQDLGPQLFAITFWPGGERDELAAFRQRQQTPVHGDQRRAAEPLALPPHLSGRPVDAAQRRPRLLPVM